MMDNNHKNQLPVSPTFILGGSSPAGTGQLYQVLEQHPDIYISGPMSPECNFFVKTAKFNKGIDHYLKEYFSGWRGEKTIGERSSHLISSHWSAKRLKQHFPQIKLIFLLRNPVDRAYAHYRFTAYAGFETLSFKDALTHEKARLKKEPPPWREVHRYAYFGRGLYYEELSHFLKAFNKSQIFILRSDVLIHNFSQTCREIFRFLTVDLDVPVKPCGDFSTPWTIDIQKQATLRTSFGRDFDSSMQKIRENITPETECDRLLLENVIMEKPKIPDDVKDELYRRYFKPNKQLESIINFSIKDWYK